MITPDYKETLAACARMLSQMLYYPPQAEFLQQLEGGALQAWPIDNQSTTQARRAMSNGLADLNMKVLSQDFTQLFVGPGPLKAYPWGSIYTGSEQQLFGQSERQLKAFCETHNIEITTDNNEPCDHIGLILVMMSVLLLRDDSGPSNAAIRQLIDEHLITWVNRFIGELSANAETEFFQGVSLLLQGYIEVVYFTFGQEITK